MPETLVYHNKAPALLPMYGRTLLPRQKQTDGDISIPDLSASLLGISTAGNNLKRYQRVCGFEARSHLPVTYPAPTDRHRRKPGSQGEPRQYRKK